MQIIEDDLNKQRKRSSTQIESVRRQLKNTKADFKKSEKFLAKFKNLTEYELIQQGIQT